MSLILRHSLSIMKVLSDVQGGFPICFRDQTHRFAFSNPHGTIVLEIEIEEIQQNRVSLELMKLVDAEPVHVVVDFDDFLALCAPVSPDLLS